MWIGMWIGMEVGKYLLVRSCLLFTLIKCREDHAFSAQRIISKSIEPLELSSKSQVFAQFLLDAGWLSFAFLVGINFSLIKIVK